MGRLFLRYLESQNLYSCCECGAHLSSNSQIISKNFQGKWGKAYLFDTVVNVSEGPFVKRTLTTGLHTVADIYCQGCQTLVGWKYENAYEESQKYKEGKFILEKAKLAKLGWS